MELLAGLAVAYGLTWALFRITDHLEREPVKHAVKYAITPAPPPNVEARCLCGWSDTFPSFYQASNAGEDHLERKSWEH